MGTAHHSVSIKNQPLSQIFIESLGHHVEEMPRMKENLVVNETIILKLTLRKIRLEGVNWIGIFQGRNR
jgi:hypothetical protein